jgi:hypothetical protein
MLKYKSKKKYIVCVISIYRFRKRNIDLEKKQRKKNTIEINNVVRW